MLLPIKVVVPVSECSSAVRTQGQLTGALVRVWYGEQPVAEGTAASADAMIPLVDGVELEFGMPLVATQTVDDETSPLSPQSTTVQKTPPELGAVTVGVVHHCSECIYVAGALPGTLTQVVRRSGGQEILRGEADTTQTLQVQIDPPADPDEQLWVRQVACGQVGQEIGASAAAAPPQPLHAPAFVTPLKECQRVLRVTGVAPGATVEVERSIGPDVTWCISAESGYLGVPALQAGEVLRVRQRFERCEAVSPFSDRFMVDPVEPIPPPVISGANDNCIGTTTVTLTKLLPTAQVRILLNDQLIGLGEVPPDAEMFTFPVPPLAMGNLTAEQGLCDLWSPPSAALRVESTFVSPEPELPGPLYPCATVVRVAGLTTGYHTVTIQSDLLLAPVGQRTTLAQAGFIDVPVTPRLIAGDAIHAVLDACQGVTSSPTEQVATTMPAVNAPDVPVPVVAGWTAVPVHSVIPGAWVDVWVNNVWRGAAGIAAVSGWVPINTTLAVGDVVEARQTMCARVSPRSRRTQVVHPPPIARFTPVPGEGAAPLTVSMHNQSFNANHATTPYEWDLGGGQSSTEVDPQRTFHTPGTHTIHLTARNASEWTDATSRQVTVFEPPKDDEQTLPVKLTKKGPSDGPNPWIGSVGPNLQRVVSRIVNPTAYTIGILKAVDGTTTADCTTSEPVVLLGPYGELTGPDFEQIWGTTTPTLGFWPNTQLYIVACAAVPSHWIWIPVALSHVPAG